MGIFSKFVFDFSFEFHFIFSNAMLPLFIQHEFKEKLYEFHGDKTFSENVCLWSYKIGLYKENSLKKLYVY